jgi:NADP-dependent 3-hydroxy acid dehydrogenase YdfG
LTDLVAVVTGASSDIGRAIAVSLAEQGAAVCAAGRNAARLGETVARAQFHSRVLPFQADLSVDEGVNRLHQVLAQELGGVDILIHSAGVIQHNLMSTARIEDLDAQYATDLRAPYLLTKSLLPMLKASHGQVVFINSSLGVNAKRPDVGQFAATQHAIKAIADSLREEVNRDGIRVLSLYLGRTATPRQQRLYEQDGRVYQPELLMQPEDVAAMVIRSLTLPRTAEVTDISMRPLLKSY